MNLLRLAAMVQQLGLSIDMTALGPLVPLLNKTTAEIVVDDIRAVLGVFKLTDVDETLVNETATAIRTSDFSTLADMLGDEKYLYPMVQKFLVSNGRVMDRLITEQPLVYVSCHQCGHRNLLDRKTIAVMAPNKDVDVVCLSCESIRTLKAGKIAAHVG